MNLLDDDWIPVRFKDGSKRLISPKMVSNPDVIALNANRADFNGSLAQFLIGLLQTTTPMDSQVEWEDWLDMPPDEDVLAQWFEPIKKYFELQDGSCRYMQDKSVLEEKYSYETVLSMLVGYPGASTLDKNIDHFVKRGDSEGLCVSCVASALTNIQFMAPEGGRGYFTSLRGGGPLTTLVVATPARSLWHDLWLNVIEKSTFLSIQGNSQKEIDSIFPWGSLNGISKVKEVFPVTSHPALVFWATPRRFWIDFDTRVVGACGVCGYEEELITQLIERPNGIKYSGWNHPHTPHYEKNKEGWFPYRPKGGDQSYKHWIGWVFSNAGKRPVRPAKAVTDFLENKHTAGGYRIWAFGYHMKKANAVAWCEATMPIYGLANQDDRSQEMVRESVGKWIEAADLATFYLRNAVKEAWFSPNTVVRGDFSGIDAAFYAATESEFYRLLRCLLDSVRYAFDDPVLVELRKAWLKRLTETALNLFDKTFVGNAPIERQNPKRVAEAHQKLKFDLYGDGLRVALGLAAKELSKGKKGTRKTKVKVA